MEWAKKYYFWISLGLIGFTSFYLVIILGFWFVNGGKAYPGVSIAGVSVAGKSENEIETILNQRIAAYTDTEIKIISNKPQSVKVSELVPKYSVAESARRAANSGKNNPFLLGVKVDIPISVTWDEAKLYKLVNDQSINISTKVVSPEIVLDGELLKVKSGDPGLRVNFAETAHNLKNSLENFDSNSIASVYTVENFTVTEVPEEKQAEILQKTKEGILLSVSGKDYPVGVNALISWVDLSEQEIQLTRIFEGDKYLNPGEITEGSLFSESKVVPFLAGLSGQINKDSKNAKLSSKEGKVVVEIADVVGQKLDTVKSANKIVSVLDEGLKKIELEVDLTKAEIRADNLAELGLTELVSRGYSNFSGSPKNRLHNLKTGASKFNGMLIRPDETFSFNTALGPVDASTGYLPELVILADKTVPEYGGGMCQVSSTAFRAALNAGLPIVERKAHAYPVSYYLPYGVDATIYLPKPDLIFKNDTGKYIFMQTYTVGNQLFFDFYGTKAARSIVFAGNETGAGGVPIVEKVSPLIYDKEARGRGSFTAVIWRLMYDATGKLIGTSKFTSKYDSPDKYPH